MSWAPRPRGSYASVECPSERISTDWPPRPSTHAAIDQGNLCVRDIGDVRGHHHRYALPYALADDAMLVAGVTAPGL